MANVVDRDGKVRIWNSQDQEVLTITSAGVLSGPQPFSIPAGTKGSPSLTLGAPAAVFGVAGDWAATTTFRAATTSSGAGTAAVGSASDYTSLIQTYVPVTNSAADYQKTSLFVQAWSDDPSTATLRALVAVDARAYIGPTNATGKVWAGFDLGEIRSGGDGTIFVRELNIYNRGTDVSTIGGSLQKTGQLMIARGPQPSTAAIVIANDTIDNQVWHHGLAMTTAALGTSDTVDSFLELTTKWVVRPSGKTVIGATTAVSVPTMLEVINPSGARDPLVFIGSSVNAPITIYYQTSTALHKMGIANTTNQFVTGTVQGDFFIAPATAGMKVHLAGTTSVFAVKQDNTMAFFNVATVAQQSGTGETVGFTAGGGTTVTDASTFTGNVGSRAYRISDIVKALKNYGLLLAT